MIKPGFESAPLGVCTECYGTEDYGRIRCGFPCPMLSEFHECFSTPFEEVVYGTFWSLRAACA